MRRNIFLITLFLLTFLKFNPVYSEECDLEFEIGESFSSVTEMLGAVSYTHLTLPTTPYV